MPETVALRSVTAAEANTSAVDVVQQGCWILGHLLVKSRYCTLKRVRNDERTRGTWRRP